MKARWFVVLGFLGAILAGSFLLWLPMSSASGRSLPVADALFTACSAVCITGLSVIEPGVALSRFGQCVLLCLVQLGCMGLMTLGTFFLLVAGRRLSLASEFTLRNAYGTSGVRGLRGLVLWVVFSTLLIEGVGAWVLHALFVRTPVGSATPPGELWFQSYYYAVMSFCNAGFSYFPNSLSVFAHQSWVLITMGLLVIMGGLGFLVIYNLCTFQFWRRNLVKRGRLSLHTRVVLVASGLLLAFMFVVFVGLEWRHALAAFPLNERMAVAFFQAVTPRTCGFTVVPVSEMQPATRFISEVLMFIGAAPGGAGGGIKITTLAVFAVTLMAICRGRRETVIYRRTVPEATVREAIVIMMVFAAMIVVGMTALLLIEGKNARLGFEDLLFEITSAVSTTGLSCGDTTTSLSLASRLVVMAAMFGGRLGALAVVLLIGGEEEVSSIRYPREELVVG